MAGGILKSFLISVAYEVDRSSEQRFAASVEKATLAVAAMGAALAAAATSVVVGVEKMSERFERLYYSSQRTAASVGNIRAMAFAVGQLGGNAEEAVGSFESFARTLREAPSRFAQLNQLGVRTNDQNGKLRDMVDIYRDFAVQLEKMPYYARLNYAKNQFGISENTLRAMENPQYLKFFDEYRQKMRDAGLDPDTAARHAVAFMNTQRGLWATVNAIYDTVFDHISTKLQGPMEKFDAWLQSHSGQITGFFNKLSDTIATAFEKVWTVVQPELQQFADWISDPKTWKGFTDWVDKMSKPETWAGFLGAVKSVYGTIKAIVDSVAQLLAFARRLDEIVLGKATTDKIWGPANADRPGATDSNGNLLPGSGGFGGSQLGGTGGLGTGLRGGGGGEPAQKESWGGWIRRKLGFGGGGTDDTPVAPPGPPGTYRPTYKLSDADLSDSVIAKINGEATSSQTSTDAVINNMFNRLGTKTYGPSGDLTQVAFAPGQYAGYRRADAKRAEYIRSRIRAIASGGVADNTHGANEYRASWYHGPWAQHHADSPVIGGNRFAYNPRGGRGPYAAYDKPHETSLIARAGRAIANSVVSPVEAAPLPKPWHMNAPTLDGSSPYGHLAPLGGDVTNKTNHVNVGETHVTIDMGGVGGHNPMSTAKTIGDHLQNQRGLTIRQFSGAIQ